MTDTVTEQLIHLSRIFKNGFTVRINNGNIDQYTDIKKPYIVSYKTLITINSDIKIFKDIDIPNVCIIGAWLNTDNNIYYIELNSTFKSKASALKFAHRHKQLAIYDMKNQKVIECGK